MNNSYIFTSERLGFRNWEKEDLEAFAAINADREVMEHFPNPLTKSETASFIQRLQKHQGERGYCYYAVELIHSGEFIGFIGLAQQDYEAQFNPATDLGWRLKKAAWGKGYATEGAKRCVEYGFNELQLERIIAVCTLGNKRSEQVMKKIGMTKMGTFDHPKLKEHPAYATCNWYEIKNG